MILIVGVLFLVASGQAASAEVKAGAAEVTVRVFTDSNFETLLKSVDSNLPVVLNFNAPWCAHCKSFAPVFEELAKKLQAHAVFGTVDSTSEKYAVSRFGVQAFPSVHLIHGGQVYPFQGERKLPQLIYFVEAGWMDQDGVPLPPPLSLWTSVLDDNFKNFRDLKVIISRKPLAAISLFMGGCLCGVLMSSLVLSVCSNRMRRRRIEQVEREEKRMLELSRYHSKSDKLAGHAIREPMNRRPVRTRRAPAVEKSPTEMSSCDSAAESEGGAPHSQTDDDGVVRKAEGGAHQRSFTRTSSTTNSEEDI